MCVYKNVSILVQILRILIRLWLSCLSNVVQSCVSAGSLLFPYHNTKYHQMETENLEYLQKISCSLLRNACFLCAF